MSDCYTYHEGDSPLLVSVPHDGRLLPPDIAARMTPEALEIPDTDWHVSQLYEFCKDLNASMIVATHSRYVVDLNRSMSDEALYEGQVSTGLCPALTFAGVAIYGDTSVVTESEKESRVVDYWQPYHEKIAQRLQQLKDCFGYALLWDAHSIPSRVPSLFPGELAELNIGTNNGASCPQEIRAAVSAVAAVSPTAQFLMVAFEAASLRVIMAHLQSINTRFSWNWRNDVICMKILCYMMRTVPRSWLKPCNGCCRYLRNRPQMRPPK